MKQGDTIKGSEIKLGMTVQRINEKGQKMSHPLFVYTDCPYYRNSLYSNDDFIVIEEIK